ncbi:MAG: hypothetical protein R3B09_05650 [Nannocystaceae bacterium]
MSWLLDAAMVLLVVICAMSCKKEHEEEKAKVNDLCENISHKGASCRGEAIECSPCNPACLDRWVTVVDSSDACGDIYVDYYECINQLGCGELEVWYTALGQGGTDYPCGEIEKMFRDACSGLPLTDVD